MIALLITGAPGLRATDGKWAVDIDGDWGNSANWVGNVIADGAGGTAYFTNDITAARTISLDSARTIGGLTFADAGAFTPGGWILSGNILTLSNSAATPIITVATVNDPIVSGLDPTNDVAINLVLAGAQGFVKKGVGTLLLGGNNTMGPIRIDEGDVGILSDSGLGGNGQPVIFNGGGVRVWNGAPAMLNTNHVLTTGSLTSLNGNYDSYSSYFTGSGTLSIHSNSRLTLGGNVPGTFKSFTGTLDLTDSPGSNETLFNLGDGNPLFDLGTVTLNLGTNGGRMDFRATVAPAIVRIGALSGGSGTRLQSSSQGTGTSLTWEIGHLNLSTTFDGVMQDRAAGQVGHLHKVGTGTLTLTGASTYTGDTTISNGTLALAATALIDSTPSIVLTRNTAVLDVSAFSPAWTNSLLRTVGGNGVVTGAVVVTSGTLSPGTSIGKLTFANDLSIDGTGGTTTNLFEIGTGTNDSILVAGNLNLSGTIAVLAVPTGAVIKNGTYTLFKWGGTLTGDTNNLVLEYPTQTGTLALGLNAANKEIFLQVSGVSVAGNLVWRGDGAANQWDLATQNWRSGANPSVFNNVDDVTFNDTGSNNVPVNIAIAAAPSSVTVNAANNYVFSTTTGGRISGGGGLYKTNTGTLTLATENDYLGATTVAAGTLWVGNGLGVGKLGAGSLTNNGKVIFNRGADLTFASGIHGTGALVQSGPDILTLSSASSTYTGSTTLSNGTLRVTSSAALGGGTLVFAGGTLNPTVQINNPIDFVGDGTITATAEIRLAGALSGSTGTLFLNTTAGNGYRFLQAGSFTFNRPIQFLSSGARTIAFYNIQSTQTFNGVISGPGGIHRRSPTSGSANDAVGGHIVFNAPNTYAGGSTFSEGNVGLGLNSVVDVDGVTVLSGPLGTGTITYSPPAQVVAPFAWVALYAVGGPRTLANPLTFAAVAGADTTQEPLTIDGTDGLTFSGAVTLNQIAFLCGVRVNNSNTVISGVISGAGGLSKLGPGTLRISGDNSYAGRTVVAGGTLLINNASGSATGLGNVTVNAGATLGGSGAIAGSVTNNGTLAPGTSIGTLSIGGDLIVAGNLAIEVNRSLAQSNDLITVTGSLSNTSTGTVTVANLGPALTAGNKFTLFNQPVLNGGTLTVTGGGKTWINSLAVDGSISVAGDAAPPTLNFTNTGAGLQFSWSGNFKLQAQTNALSVGLSNNWGDYPGGSSSPVAVPVNAANGTVFFRLSAP